MRGGQFDLICLSQVLLRGVRHVELSQRNRFDDRWAAGGQFDFGCLSASTRMVPMVRVRVGSQRNPSRPLPTLGSDVTALPTCVLGELHRRPVVGEELQELLAQPRVGTPLGLFRLGGTVQ